MAIVKVILMAGQSNCQGFGTITNLNGTNTTNLATSALTNINIWDSGDVGWDVLDASSGAGNTNQARDTLSLGAEMQIGFRFQQQFSGEEIYIVKLGDGNSALAQKIGDNDWNVKSDQNASTFRDDFLVPALDNLIAGGDTPQIVGLYWQQGEADSSGDSNGATANLPWDAPIQYERNLVNLVGYWRASLGVDFPVICAGMKDSASTEASRFGLKSKLVMGSFRRIKALVGNADFVVSTAEGGADDTHFTADQNVDMGDLFADKIIAGGLTSTVYTSSTDPATDVPTVTWVTRPDDFYAEGASVSVEASASGGGVSSSQIVWKDENGNTLGSGAAATFALPRRGFTQIIPTVATTAGLIGTDYDYTYQGDITNGVVTSLSEALHLRQGVGLIQSSNGQTGTVIDLWPTSVLADSGTTDGTTVNELVDSTKDFSSTVIVGDAVQNTTDETFALVTDITNAATGRLVLDADIMASGEDYTIGAHAIEQEATTAKSVEGYLGASGGSDDSGWFKITTNPMEAATDYSWAIRIMTKPSFSGAAIGRIMGDGGNNIGIFLDGMSNGTNRLYSGKASDSTFLDNFIDLVDDDTLYNVVATHKADGTVKYFVNGVTDNAYASTYRAPGGVIGLGATAGGSAEARSPILEFILYDGLLTDEEALNLSQAMNDTFLPTGSPTLTGPLTHALTHSLTHKLTG